MIKINAKKTYRIAYQDKDDKDISFAVTFKFPYSDDVPVKEGEQTIEYILRICRDAIIKTEGIIDDETGEEIIINDNFLCVNYFLKKFKAR